MISPDVLDLIRRHHSVLCISHVAPDGDAVGSLLGMGWILRRLGKEATLALADPAPTSFDFLTGLDQIVDAQTLGQGYDLVICLDASSRDRMGNVFRQEVHGRLPLLVIDHHVTNTCFGTVNWVDPGCAATCQMLVSLAETLDVPLDGDLAWALLTGLVTDTHCFRTSNTDAPVLAAAMRLMEGGADLSQIAANTLNREPFRIIQLWGHVMPHVQLEKGVIWTTVSWEAQSAVGEHREDGGLSSRLITVEEAVISATFTESRKNGDPQAVICSFRAKPGHNVSQLALAHGGGGHPQAAGCTIVGPLHEVAAAVVAELQTLTTA